MSLTQQRVPVPGWVNYSLLALAVIAYSLLSAYKPRSARAVVYGFSDLELLLITLSVSLPYVISWGLAVYGLTRLGAYLEKPEAKENEFTPLLHSIRRGLTWIIVGTIVAALVSSLKTYVAGMTIPATIITIIVNYLYIFPTLFGFWHIYHGAHALQITNKISLPQWRSDQLIKTILVTVLIVFYIFLIFTNTDRHITYRLSDVLITLTIIIPIFVTWWLGFSAAFIMSDLIPRITSTHLFKAMTRFLYGLWAVIFTSILIQAVLSLGTTRLESVGVAMLLAIVYIFVLLHGAGYIFLAAGINSLKFPKARNRQ